MPEEAVDTRAATVGLSVPPEPVLALGRQPFRWAGALRAHHRLLVDHVLALKLRALSPYLDDLDAAARRRVLESVEAGVRRAQRLEQVQTVIESLTPALLGWTVALATLTATAWPPAGPWYGYLAAPVAAVVAAALTWLAMMWGEQRRSRWGRWPATLLVVSVIALCFAALFPPRVPDWLVRPLRGAGAASASLVGTYFLVLMGEWLTRTGIWWRKDRAFPVESLLDNLAWLIRETAAVSEEPGLYAATPVVGTVSLSVETRRWFVRQLDYVAGVYQTYAPRALRTGAPAVDAVILDQIRRTGAAIRRDQVDFFYGRRSVAELGETLFDVLRRLALDGGLFDEAADRPGAENPPSSSRWAGFRTLLRFLLACAPGVMIILVGFWAYATKVLGEEMAGVVITGGGTLILAFLQPRLSAGPRTARSRSEQSGPLHRR
ncbi:hypothetical protein IMZ11_07925 [Microtetraspora sp. AC03309]|uniref:hypothetical protein n=1 Tax=Microtetraspora sp. AC03309 TaxID=2779376 RepID=UPI001E5C31AA|nr:hypothetical protein [Microtetraspora sp. AC03309]MCC5575568.1 hypothetical protein [Microtetraspora sp. AC03309]